MKLSSSVCWRPPSRRAGVGRCCRTRHVLAAWRRPPVRWVAEAVLYRWQRGMVSLFAKSHAGRSRCGTCCGPLSRSGPAAGSASSTGRRCTPPRRRAARLLPGRTGRSPAVSVLVRAPGRCPVVTRNIGPRRCGCGPPRALAAAAPSRAPAGGLRACRASGRAAGDGGHRRAGVRCGEPRAVPVGGLTGPGALPAAAAGAPAGAGEQEVLDWFEARWRSTGPPSAPVLLGRGVLGLPGQHVAGAPRALEGRPVIVLRERFMVQRGSRRPTSVVCLSEGVHADAPGALHARVLLHPPTRGRPRRSCAIPTIKHAFVNHGESDKLSSCNPYAKAYDEVVGGRPCGARAVRAGGGRRRGQGRDGDRPPAAGRPYGRYAGPPAPGAFTTVLYAPTWEGWDGNPGNTSVLSRPARTSLRALLADPGVPAAVQAASADGVGGSAGPGPPICASGELVRAANRERSGSRPGASTAAELARRTVELDRLHRCRFPVGRRPCGWMLRRSAPEPGRAGAVARATAAWERAYWASLPEVGSTRSSRTPGRRCHACFNRADLLISDVSSVISDFWRAASRPRWPTPAGWPRTGSASRSRRWRRRPC
ncbi:hypothetical protein LV779_28325 [Streptomyces thinghirensis]|nr:hypothetical protein [Streptomyces thinghirensis]